MRGLSLRQPWAHFVVHGILVDDVVVRKPIENRTWTTKVRGEFLVHAAKGMSLDEYALAIAFAKRTIGGGHAIVLPSPDDLQRGGFIGRAELVDVISPCLSEATCTHPWHMAEQFGFVLDKVRAIPFVRWPGSLGFFGAPQNVLDALDAQRGAA